jgi:hypothetical protein
MLLFTPSSSTTYTYVACLEKKLPSSLLDFLTFIAWMISYTFLLLSLI